jgi:anti-anti-sigma regulatory factor
MHFQRMLPYRRRCAQHGCPAAATHCRFARANGIDRVEFIILDLTPVPHMDSMGAHFLEELNEVRRCGVVC